MYYGHYDSVPEHAKKVAAAFYAGKRCKRSNCETDGEKYWVNDVCIAQRIDIPARVARKLLDEKDWEKDSWSFPTMRITCAGWDTWMTARHLMALGFKAQPSSKGRKTPFLIDGRKVPIGIWITKEELEALPRWEVIENLRRVCEEDARRRRMRPAKILNLELEFA